MGVLHSIPLCARGNNTNIVEPLELDKNNNDVVYTSQPSTTTVPPPEATSTPVRPQSPTGFQNEQYSDSLASSSDNNSADDEEPVDQPPASSALSDSGLEESATEFEFSRPSPQEQQRNACNFDAKRQQPNSNFQFADHDNANQDEGVHEEFDDTLVLDDHEEIDLNDGEDPLERPPEPTVPDERCVSSSGSEDEPITAKDETSRKISSLLSELVGDRPAGEAVRPDLVPMR